MIKILDRANLPARFNWGDRPLKGDGPNGRGRDEVVKSTDEHGLACVVRSYYEGQALWLAEVNHRIIETLVVSQADRSQEDRSLIYLPECHRR
jgi:hypothetical protein